MRCDAVLALALVMALASAAPAAAADGEVSGTIGPVGARHAAVWLEGAPVASTREVPAISQKGARFQPEFLVVTVGQSVSLPNDDRIIHNVFSVSPTKKFDLGHYPQGDVRTVRFDKPGVVDLFCNIHDNMHATIVVAPSSAWAIVGADGTFTISHVPPGTYRVVAFSPEAGTASQVVHVAAGSAATVTFEKLR